MPNESINSIQENFPDENRSEQITRGVKELCGILETIGKATNFGTLRSFASAFYKLGKIELSQKASFVLLKECIDLINNEILEKGIIDEDIGHSLGHAYICFRNVHLNDRLG